MAAARVEPMQTPPRPTPRESTEAMVRNIDRELAEIEQAIGRPVVTSNQAVVWHALHLMQLAAPTQAPGRLFDATRVR